MYATEAANGLSYITSEELLFIAISRMNYMHSMEFSLYKNKRRFLDGVPLVVISALFSAARASGTPPARRADAPRSRAPRRRSPSRRRAEEFPRARAAPAQYAQAP